MLVWSFGVLQKETSTCVLLLAPFLWPTIRAELGRWRVASPGTARRDRPRGRRRPAAVRPDGRADDPARTCRPARLRERGDGDEPRLADLRPALAVGRGARLEPAGPRRARGDRARGSRRVPDSASTGCRSACSPSPSRSSRSPPTRASSRAATTFRRSCSPRSRSRGAPSRSAPSRSSGAGLLLAGGGLYQARSAHDWVAGWVDAERSRETIVRAAAARVAGGCEVRAVGLNVELVAALPVLMPLAHEPPRGCTPGERFVVVIDRGAPGTVTPPDNPILAACRAGADAGRDRRRRRHLPVHALSAAEASTTTCNLCGSALRRGARRAVREGRPLDRALPALRARLPLDAARARRARRDLRADVLRRRRLRAPRGIPRLRRRRRRPSHERPGAASAARGARSPPGPLLDVGCAAGFFVDEATRTGWQARGVDVSRPMVDWARARLGADLRLGHARGRAARPRGVVHHDVGLPRARARPARRRRAGPCAAPSRWDPRAVDGRCRLRRSHASRCAAGT